MLCQFPGVCITTNEEKTYDYLSFAFKDIYAYNSKIQCSSSIQLSDNPLSPIYFLGIYPVDIYVLSPFVWDMICLFAVYVHMKHMETSGNWDELYLIKKSLSDSIVYNYDLQLHEKKEKMKYCIVKPTTNNPKLFENQNEAIPVSQDDILFVRRVYDNGTIDIQTYCYVTI